MRRLQELFDELQWIPEYLSQTVHSLGKLSFEKEDLKQELRLKLWESLNAYFQLIKQGKKPKMNIRRYCHAACLNRKVDFIRMLLANKRTFEQINLSEMNTDIGKEETNINIEFDEDCEEDLAIKIDGFDILSVTDDLRKKLIFKDFILGFSYIEISILYGITKDQVNNIIHDMRKKIREKFSDDYVKQFDFQTLFYIEREIEEELVVQSKVNLAKENLKDFQKKVNNKVYDKHRKYIKTKRKF